LIYTKKTEVGQNLLENSLLP